MGAALVATVSSGARAQPAKVTSPIVEQGEAAIEIFGEYTRDRDASKNAGQRQSYEIEYGVTDFWKLGIEAKRKKEPGGSINYDATEIENVFQLTQPGEYWLTLGALVSLELPRAEDDPNEIEFGLLLQKDIGNTVNIVNLIFPRQIGPHSSSGVEFEYAVQSIYEFVPEFGVGLEAFGALGEIKNMPAVDRQDHRAGPVIGGKFGFGTTALRYELAYLRALTTDTPDTTLRGLIELELHF